MRQVVERCMVLGALITLSSGAGKADTLTVALREIEVQANFQGRPVSVKVSGSVVVGIADNALTADVTAIGNLSAMQTIAPQVIQGQLAHNDDCDYVLTPHTVSLKPGGAGGANVYVGAHFEKWACPWTDVPLVGRVSLGKTKVFEQNGDVTVIITPAVQAGGAVVANVSLGDTHADGLLGELLKSTLLGPLIRDRIAQELPSLVTVGSLGEALPPQLRPYRPELQSLRFLGLGGDVLGMEVKGRITVTGEQAARILNELAGAQR